MKIKVTILGKVKHIEQKTIELTKISGKITNVEICIMHCYFSKICHLAHLDKWDCEASKWFAFLFLIVFNK